MNFLTNTGFYRFRELRLDVPNRLLWRGEKQVSLTIKEFDLLLVFVENAGRVLSKDELLEAVWADAFVEEATLARNISWLRKKLETGDDGGDQFKFIETITKRGYRFAATVEKTGEQPLEQSRAIVVEEHTLTRVEIEESIIIGDRETENATLGRSPIGTLPAPIENSLRYRSLAALTFGILAAAIGFVVWQNFFRESEPKVVLTSRVAPFSGLPGRENFPAFSPDGKLLAFVWNGGAGDNFDVYVRQTEAGAPVRLTDTKEDEVHPVFSPDGSQIVFIRRFLTHSEIYSVPALGGAERKICDLQSAYSRLSFAPDGKTIAAADAEAFDKPKSIYFIDAASGAKRRITAPPETTADISARFSPDGKTLAFLREFGGGAYAEIFLASVSDDGGAAVRQLTFDKTEINGLDWSADGGKIIYAARTSAHAPSLRQISIGGGAPESIAVGGKNITNPTASRDGRTIAFVEESYKTSIARIEPDAPARRFIESSGDDHSPNLSPDNSQIAFVSNRTGNLEIWIADAAGKNQRRLTNLLDSTVKKSAASPEFPDSAGSPRFSPDGKFIAYDAHVNGNGDVYVVSVDGGTPRRITSGAWQEILPAWSADGRWIYFTSNQTGDFNLWRIPADGGGQAVQITKNGAFESFAAPDGKSIFYTRASDAAEIWRVPIGGGEESTAAADLSKAGLWRYWTVSPTGIYFTARQTDESLYRIKFYDFENRRVKTVAQTESPPIWTFSGLTAAAAARTILYVQTEQNASNIMLADLLR